jgi:hypothetical protein
MTRCPIGKYSCLPMDYPQSHRQSSRKLSSLAYCKQAKLLISDTNFLSQVMYIHLSCDLSYELVPHPLLVRFLHIKLPEMVASPILSFGESRFRVDLKTTDVSLASASVA